MDNRVLILGGIAVAGVGVLLLSRGPTTTPATGDPSIGAVASTSNYPFTTPAGYGVDPGWYYTLANNQTGLVSNILDYTGTGGTLLGPPEIGQPPANPCACSGPPGSCDCAARPPPYLIGGVPGPTRG